MRELWDFADNRVADTSANRARRGLFFSQIECEKAGVEELLSDQPDPGLGTAQLVFAGSFSGVLVVLALLAYMGSR